MLEGVTPSTLPVETVSWNDAVAFCLKLSRREGLSPSYTRLHGITYDENGTGYRLPSEAEWEYACAAGTTTRYFTGNSDVTLSRAAWFDSNANSRTHSVAALHPNPFGLYDMHGNVWEWVEDGWDPRSYFTSINNPAINPSSSFEESTRCVMRGGKYDDLAIRSRTANREGVDPQWSQMVLGFRIALSIDAVREATASRKVNRSSYQPEKKTPDHPPDLAADSELHTTLFEHPPPESAATSITRATDLISAVDLGFDAASSGFPDTSGPQIRVSFNDRAVEMSLLEGGLWWSSQPVLHDLGLEDFVCEVTGRFTASGDWCAWGIGVLPIGEARSAWTGIGVTSDNCVFVRRYNLDNPVPGQPLPSQSDVFQLTRLRLERRKGQLRIFVDDHFIKELGLAVPKQCHLTVYLAGKAGVAARFTSIRVWKYHDLSAPPPP